MYSPETENGISGAAVLTLRLASTSTDSIPGSSSSMSAPSSRKASPVSTAVSGLRGLIRNGRRAAGAGTARMVVR